MKLETFKAGVWRQQYQYKSFQPTLVNQLWTWEDPVINTLLEQATKALGELNAFSLIVPDIDLFIDAELDILYLFFNSINRAFTDSTNVRE